MLKRVALILLLFALPITGIVVLGVLGTHKFNTLPYFTSEGQIDSLATDAQRVGESFNSQIIREKLMALIIF